MSNITLFYIIIATIAALLFAIFQYFYKIKHRSQNLYLLALLRFISFLGIALLLINPKFKKTTLTNIKPNLVLLIDNTKSMISTKEVNNVKLLSQKIQSTNSLQDKFTIKKYNFSSDLNFNDSLKFDQSNTLIYKTLTSVNKLYNKEIAPVILITDGNQTQGLSYDSFNSKQNIYPIIIGDTTVYQDLKLQQLNVNKYAFLNKKFPIETFILYQGKKNSVKATFTVKENSHIVFTKKITLGKDNNAEQISFYLPANSVGIHNYKASISVLKNEKNTINNVNSFSVEVINEKAKIVLITNINHPDIGMLKRVVESNKQRKLEVKKPTDVINFSDYQLVIIYQPDNNFKTVLEKVKNANKNVFYFTGTKTNWDFLNANQTYFSKKAIKTEQDYKAIFNSDFDSFITTNIGFSEFSPVQDFFGDILFNLPVSTLLFQQIENFKSKSPLLVNFKKDNIKGAVFFGENIWRWRMTSFVEEKSFEKFDTFFSKTIQYLVSTKQSNLLEIENKKHFYENENVIINAFYYDANYKFDANATLWVSVKDKNNKEQLKYPFSLDANKYVATISNLKSGNYTFKVFDNAKKHIKNGSFTVLSHGIEQQYVGANKKQLIALALNSKGKAYYIDEFEKLKDDLLNNKNYKSIQKSKQKIIPLIDWKWLLAIITLSLSIEWFIRKYKGLI